MRMSGTAIHGDGCRRGLLGEEDGHALSRPDLKEHGRRWQSSLDYLVASGRMFMGRIGLGLDGYGGFLSQ